MISPTVKAAIAYPLGFCRSTIAVAALCLRAPDTIAEHEIIVPVPSCSPTRLYLIANLLSYTPGTLVIGTTADDELVVHVVAASSRSRDDIICELRNFVEVWT